jgi:5-methylcytosine-specific restriction protein A
MPEIIQGAQAICPGPFRTLDEAKRFGVDFKVPPNHCRWCGKPCEGRRSTFCSGRKSKVRRGQVVVPGSGCVEQWMLRSSTLYLREEVFRRDGGICKRCGMDTLAVAAAVQRMPTDVEWASRKGLLLSRESVLGALGFAKTDGWTLTSLWHADHIVPVERGGGLCGLNGMQTLCAPCHRRKTAEEAKEPREDDR